MIKKLLLAAAIAGTSLSMSAQKFGVVNTQEVIESLPAYTEMKTKIETSSKTYEDEFARLQQQFEKAYTDFQNLGENELEPIKQRRMQELQELDQKIQQFRATAQQDLQRQQLNFMQPIQDTVMKAIRSVGAQGGYTFIFDSEMALYAGQEVKNVTDEVKATALTAK